MKHTEHTDREGKMFRAKFWITTLLVLAGFAAAIGATAVIVNRTPTPYVSVAPAQICTPHGGTDHTFSTTDFAAQTFTGNVYCRDGSTFGYTDGEQDR